MLIGVHVAALLSFFPAFFSWSGVAVMALLYGLCGVLGLNLRMHRLLAHRSFVAAKPIEYALAWLASLTWQGGTVWWVAVHRMHHESADSEGDPHSPRAGLLHSHLGWMFAYDPRVADPAEYGRYARDVAKDPVHVAIERLALPSQLLLALGLYALGGGSWVIWGIFVRMVAVYHMTWAINSAAHRWGYRSFDTPDDSRNLWWLALVTGGERHNNHHARPGRPRHGLRGWELDFTWLVVRLLEKLGLARVASAGERG